MLARDNTVLVFVDIQGKLAELMHDKETLFANLVRLAKAGRVLGLPILWNEQIPAKLGPTIPALAQELCGLQPMAKSCFSCCGSDAFMRALRDTGRRELLLAGIETHVCVYQTAVGLLGDGYQVEVVADAVSSRFAHNKQIGLERMKDAGARITSTEMALFELLRVAGTPEFSEIVKIVK